MQMIDLMKRLAELDAKNSNIVKQPVSEVSVDYVANKVAGAMNSPNPRLGWSRAAQTLDKMSSKFGSHQSNQAVQKASEKMTADKIIPDLIDKIQSGDMKFAFWDLPLALQQDVSFLQHFADALDAEGLEGHADAVRDGLATAEKRQRMGKWKGVTEGSPGDYTFTTAINGMLGDDKEFEVTYHYSKGEDPRYYGSSPSPGGPASVEIISVKDLETGQDVSVKNVGKDIWAEFEEEAWYDYKENHQHDNFQDPEYDRDDRYEGVKEGSAHGYNVARWYEKNEDQIKLTKWLKKEAGLPKDAPVYFDDADLVYDDKTIVPNALVDSRLKFNDLLTALVTATGSTPKQYKDGIYREQGVAEGSGPKEKQHSKYVDRSSPESKAKVQAAKDKMASDKAAEPGKKLADKKKQGVAEGYSLGKVLPLPEMLDQIGHILTSKHRGIGWKMKKHGDNTFVFSAQNDYNVWSMLVVKADSDKWVTYGNGIVTPEGKSEVFDRQQLPMTLASASEIADEAIKTYHDIDLSDYADPNELNEQGWKNVVAGGALALSALGSGAQTIPNVNAQQVELTNKYYATLVQRAKEDGRKLDTRTLNFLKAKAQDAAALKIQQNQSPQSQSQNSFPSQGSERKVAKDFDKFESQGVAEGLQECGMMGGMSQPRTPASINMTAGSGEELSSMLKDIMTLAGRPMQEPMGGEEPMGGADGIAVVNTEPGVELDSDPDMGTDEPSIMRSMLDKLNPSDGDSDNDSSGDIDDVKKVNEYDNEPNPEMSGYGASINPPGNGIDRQKSQHPMAAAKGDNPLEATYESLMADYRKFMAESNDVGEGAKMPNQDPRDNYDRLHPEHPGNRGLGRGLADKIKQRTGNDYYGLGRKEAGMKPIDHYADRPQLPGESVEDESEEEMRNSAHKMTLDQFERTYGEQNGWIWYEEHPKELTLETMKEILADAEAGVNVIDDIADELGDLFDAVHNSGDQNLIDAYTMVRELENGDSLEEQKQALIQAIRMIDPTHQNGVNENQDILRLAGLR